MSSPSSSFPTKNSINHNKKIRAHLLISGKVQGVYFRHNTQIVAYRHKVTGWVRNLKDGQLEVALEGDEIDVGHVIKWCKIGPPEAKVEHVNVQYENYIGEFKEFKVNY
ncbi:MAG: acylphosphatase [Nitrososphaeraceae archaeon]